MLVLDVSVAATWFLADERDPAIDELLTRVSIEGAYVPALFRWEIQNALLSAERSHRMTASDVDEAIERLRDLPIRIEPAGERVFSGSEVALARHYDLTAYDAAYLALASMHRIDLATLDRTLSHAARDLGIAVVPGLRR